MANDSFRQSNDGRAEPATTTNDGNNNSSIGSAKSLQCAHTSFASIGCATASNNDGFSRNAADGTALDNY
jgi:hypothetical protein